jgi:predicted RNA-binding Zn-ribbon protein involved in translation (DUF1610 family)
MKMKEEMYSVYCNECDAWVGYVYGTSEDVILVCPTCGEKEK